MCVGGGGRVGSNGRGVCVLGGAGGNPGSAEVGWLRNQQAKPNVRRNHTAHRAHAGVSLLPPVPPPPPPRCRSNYCVWLLRMVTSADVKRRADFFAPFVLGLSDLDVPTFCAKCIDPLGEESDHVQLVALTDALQVRGRGAGGGCAGAGGRGRGRGGAGGETSGRVLQRRCCGQGGVQCLACRARRAAPRLLTTSSRCRPHAPTRSLS